MKLALRLIEEIIEPEGNLGLSRDEMPQIDGKDMPDFLAYVRSEGSDYETGQKKASELTATQNELDTDKADKIWNDGNAHESPIIVSGDGYVLDGHHRWLAVQRNDPDGEIGCIILSDNAKPALELMHGFEGAKKRDIEDQIVEKLALQVINIHEGDKPVNYKLKVLILFDDGALNPRGSAVKVKATDPADAEKVAREQIHKHWQNVKKIEILSVKKGS